MDEIGDILTNLHYAVEEYKDARTRVKRILRTKEKTVWETSEGQEYIHTRENLLSVIRDLNDFLTADRDILQLQRKK